MRGEGLEEVIMEIVENQYPIVVKFENGKRNQYQGVHLEPV